MAQLPAAPPGETLRLECSSNRMPGRSKRLAAASAVVSERSVDPDRGINLRELASVSGGQVVSLDGQWSSLSPLNRSGKHLRPLSSWLLALALLLFVSELIWRRRPQPNSQ
ncbi:MAG: hypothetical protein MI861_18855 [Pirellulales bacterium]|nr:hypothetical protein [Pirellulales bacterium]